MSKLLITLFVMLLASTAFATTAFIQPPIQHYTFHVVEGKINKFPGSVKIENRNGFAVNVVFSKPSWVDIASSVQLQPSESRNVSFNMIFTESGSYSGDITAMYTASGKLSAPASSSITVDAIYNGTYVNANPPSTPQLVSPSNGLKTHDNILTLQWSASADPDGDTVIYYYYVDDNNAFSSPDVSGSTAGGQQQAELAYNTYYWKIVATDGKYNSSSATRSFVLGNDPPSAPQLAAPSDGAQLSSLPMLEWSGSVDADNDAITYEVLVDDATSFNTPVVKQTTTATQFALSGLAAGTWYWKVKANDGVVKTDSQVRSFSFGTTTATSTTTSTTSTTQPMVCAADVFMCPDGSYVSRNPSNNCQFRPCSSTTTSTSTTTTTTSTSTTTTSTTTTTAPEPMTISVLQGSSVEIAIIMLVVISTAIGAVFILRR